MAAPQSSARFFYRRWLLLTPMPLEIVCSKVRETLDLPEFTFDCEIDSRWGISRKEGVEVNVTHWDVGRRRRFEELPRGFPDYNYMIIVSGEESLSVQTHWFLDRSIGDFSRLFANMLGTTSHYIASPWGELPARFWLVEPTKVMD